MEQLFVENKSKFDFGETLTELTRAIQEGGWRLVYMHDLQETMAKKQQRSFTCKSVGALFSISCLFHFGKR